VIRDAVIHMNNEQPLVCDLREMPDAGDLGLLCTNLRLVDGRKPTFIDATDSWFIIPYHIIRFVEMPLSSVEAGERLALPPGPIVERSDEDEDDGDLDDLEDRDGDEDEMDDASEELLQRIREV
jgi:hypothetical protein